MRREQTPAETELWALLRSASLGVRVRRQQPIGPFIADFLVGSVGLVIEVDGGIHEHPEVAAQDAYRTEYLNACGMTVLRLRNAEIFDDPNGCLRRISAEIDRLRQPPSPNRVP